MTVTASANTTDLVLTLTNGLSAAVTFTITHNHYTSTMLTESAAAGATRSSDISATFAAKRHRRDVRRQRLV